MTTRNTTLLAAIAAASVTFGFSAGNASAADMKYYSGHNCQPKSAANAARIGYGSNGETYNESTATAYITCPIIRDQVSEHWDYVRVVFKDRHTTANASCSLGFVDRSGVVRQTRTLTSYGTGTVVRGLSSPHDDGGFFASASVPEAPQASYVLNCVLPGKQSARHFLGSGLVRYEFQEH